MSGITSGVGVFSGIDRNSIISQLLSIDARPKAQFQRRIASLQSLSAAYLDVSSKIGSLRGIAQAFRTERTFESAAANSSNKDVLEATASNGAPAGEYRVTVGRLATTQQVLTRGFASTSTGLGLTEVIVEGVQGRLDNSNRLSTLNGGNGVQRGTIQITDGTGATASVDLTRASTIQDVIDTINNTTGVRVRARLDDTYDASEFAGNAQLARNAQFNGLVIEDVSGGSASLTIANTGGTTTATDLGIAGTAARNTRLDANNNTSAAITGTQIRGRRINTIGTNTALNTLNDGLGVGFSTTIGPSPDLSITLRDGNTFEVDLGAVYGGTNGTEQTAGPSNTLADVISRINAASGGRLTASISADGSGLTFVDSSGGTGTTTIASVGTGTTALDLGIDGTFTTATFSGQRLIGKLNSVSTARLQGGGGFVDNVISGTYRDNTTFNFTVDTSLSLSDLLNDIKVKSGGRLNAGVDQSGNRVTITDTTGGTGALRFNGTDLVSQLGLGLNNPSGTATGDRQQRQYINGNTQLSTLNYGRGIGTGTFEVVTRSGQKATVNLGTGSTTVNELINAINSAGRFAPTGSPSGTPATQQFQAFVNDSGDGIVIKDLTTGNNPLSIRDTSGAVARSLFLAGTAATGTPAEINGSYERRITVNPADGLSTLANAINNSGLNVRASTLQDGSANPFRLSISSRTTGVAGAFSIDAVGADLGLNTTNAGRDALIFYGSDNTSNALAVESSSNTVAGAIPGVSLTLKQTSTSPVTISVSTDVEKIKKKIGEFVEAYNDLVESIASRSKFDAEGNKRGVLLGDSATSELRGRLQNLITSPAQGVQSDFRFLTEVGIKLGTGGKISLDSTKLEAALQRDPRGVVDLFSARVQSPNSSTRTLANGITVTESVAGAITSKGVMEILADELDNYTRSTTGVLTRQSKTIDDQIKAQNDRIKSVDSRIEARRKILEAQFLRMESSIGRLQSQSGAVSQIRAVS